LRVRGLTRRPDETFSKGDVAGNGFLLDDCGGATGVRANTTSGDASPATDTNTATGTNSATDTITDEG
jgi:hypothetical protein